MRRVVLAILTVCLAIGASAQQQLERDQVSGTSAQVLTYNVKLAAPAFTFEYLLTGSPASASIVLQGCMRGGTCETIETNTSTSNTKRSVIGVYDYFTFTPTLGGGSSPKLQVNVTGMVAATIPSATNATQAVNLTQVSGGTVPSSGITGVQPVAGAETVGAAPVGKPVMIGFKDSGGNTQYPVAASPAGGSGIFVGNGAGNAADATSFTGNVASPNSQSLFWRSVNYCYNGTTGDVCRSASLANFPTAVTSTAVNSIGTTLVENGSRWSKVSTPAVSTLATASIAAEASVRHVATGVCFSAGSTTAPALTKLNINLRDGASGAGTVLASWTVIIPAATGQNVAPTCFPVGPFVGTTNTAMTLEFSALLTSLFEDVTLSGYNVN
jgi:hypothetical protein